MKPVWSSYSSYFSETQSSEPNEQDITAKRTKLDTIRYLLYANTTINPAIEDIIIIIIIITIDMGSDWLIPNLGTLTSAGS